MSAFQVIEEEEVQEDVEEKDQEPPAYTEDEEEEEVDEQVTLGIAEERLRKEDDRIRTWSNEYISPLSCNTGRSTNTRCVDIQQDSTEIFSNYISFQVKNSIQTL